MTTTTATPASQDAPAAKPLTFTWVYEYDPGDLLPEEGRAAWLEKYGIPPDHAEVQVTLPLTAWEMLGFAIQPHGTVITTRFFSDYKCDEPSKFAIRVALAFARASIQTAGVVPGVLPAEAFCVAYQAERDEAYARWHLLRERYMTELQPTNGLWRGTLAFNDDMTLREYPRYIHDLPTYQRVVPPQHQAWARQVLATHKRAQEEQAARNEAAYALRKEQEQTALEYFNGLEQEALKAAVYGLGVPQVATASQRERFEAGVLPSEEAYALLATLALGPVMDLEEDEPWEEVDVCDREYGREVRFTKTEVHDYTDAAWALRKKVLELLPDAAFVLTDHGGSCDCEEHEVLERRSLLVRARAPHGQVYSRRLKI